MKCPQCGAANRDDARFCGACGAASSTTEPTSAGPGEAPGPSGVIGREIAGRYRMLAKLGEGGMGAVFRAEQISLKRTVAVKLLRPDVVANKLLLRRFNAEAEAVAKLNHPNTVNIYDFGQDSDGTLFIAMEYIEGRSLRAVIQGEAPLLPRRALAIASQVAASLADAHARSIVHRDLKPDNVMLQDRGRERDVVRVLDFGIAKLRDEDRATQLAMTQQGDMLGTPQYMAPEQIRAEHIDGRTDVYALGCLLYEMVTGRLPHEAPTVLALLSKHLLEQPVPPSQRRPELGLPPALDALILGAMAKDPRARPATMELMGEQIAGLLASLPPDPHAPHAGPHAAPRTGALPVTAAPTPGVVPSPYVGTPPPGVARADTPAAFPSYVAPPYAPAPYAAPHGAPPYNPIPPPQQHAWAPQPVRPASRHRTAIIAVAGVLAAAGIAAAIIATRAHTHAATQAPDDAGHDDPDDDPDDERDAGPADPWAPSGGGSAAPRAPDPWAGSAPDGTRVEVGQGVALLIPPGFTTTVQNGVTVALDGRGVMIAAGAIDVATNDPRELARIHAKRNGLHYDAMQSVVVGGVKRAMPVFRGAYGGVLVRHFAVPLIGPGYRVAVIFQAPERLLKSEPAIAALAGELYASRIVLP